MFNFRLPGRRKPGNVPSDGTAERARREANANAAEERLQRRLTDVVASLETPPVDQTPAKAAAPAATAPGEGRPVATSGNGIVPAAAPNGVTTPVVGGAAAQPPANGVAAPLSPPQATTPFDPSDAAALEEAKRRASEQRQAAEAMLLEAQLLEQRIASEASATLSEAEQRAIQEGQRAAARALALEQHAAEQAAKLQERMDRMIGERKGHELQADAVRVTERQAQAEVDSRQALLEEALKAAAAAAIAVTEVDRVVVGYMKREELLRKEIDQLNARVTDQREMREAAETYVREAEERLAQIGGGDAPRTSIEEIRAIEARLTEQLEAAHRAAHPDIAEGSPATQAGTASPASASPPGSEATTAMPHVA